MPRGTLISIADPGVLMEVLNPMLPPEVVPAGLVPVAGAVVVPVGALRGVSFCCGAEVCAEAVAANAPNEAISKALRIFRCIIICSFPMRLAVQPQWIGPM